MNHDEIRKQAKKKVQAKKEFYIVAFIFAAVSAILLVISFSFGMGPVAGFWIRFPILIFAMVIGIMYLSIFGIPGTRLLSAEWEEDEMTREIYHLYRQKGVELPADTELSEEDRLELKELERLKQKWGDRDDFV